VSDFAAAAATAVLFSVAGGDDDDDEANVITATVGLDEIGPLLFVLTAKPSTWLPSPSSSKKKKKSSTARKKTSGPCEKICNSSSMKNNWQALYLARAAAVVSFEKQSKVKSKAAFSSWRMCRRLGCTHVSRTALQRERHAQAHRDQRRKLKKYLGV